ncbi:hypothetical protein ON05_006770 [Acaryochloris sp. CCMEE 5410]|nr:hypothetical protein ON05_006770 [Acaryochloris sp. CCMEE 5410]
MKNLSSPTFACRYCQHYSPEGRRGGQCQRLGAPVRGEWKACSLMIPSFSSTIEVLSVSHQQKSIEPYRLETVSARRVLTPTL